MKLSPGDLIDQKYRVVGLLGQGGMGSVYEAENIRIDRRVAIKVLNRISSPSDVARFEREARVAQVGSPYIVQVYDLGNLSDGAPYMVMEYLSGESLGERIVRKGRLEPPEILPIALQILDGLDAAHRVGIVHRDLKPDNVFLARVDGASQETVKLLDFGISKYIDSTRASAEPSLTKSGTAVGTPHYMSPEQVRGLKELDTRTDLYSLGVILYQSLSGRLPFATNDIVPLLSQILLETPEPLTLVVPGFDADLSALVARAMARCADDRYQSAAELREALQAWQTGCVSRAAPTTEVPPVALGGRGSALLQRGLIGGLVACFSAVCVVGVAKLVQGTNSARQAPANQTPMVTPSMSVALGHSATVTVAPVVTPIASSAEVDWRRSEAVATGSRGKRSATAVLPSATMVPPPAATTELSPPPSPRQAKGRERDPPTTEAGNRHMSRLPGM